MSVLRGLVLVVVVSALLLLCCCSSVSCGSNSSSSHVPSSLLLCNSSCGNLTNIIPPFRLRSDPPHCGSEKYELLCDDASNRTVLYYDDHDNRIRSTGKLKLYVEAINYNNYTIRVVDEGIHEGNCSSLPLQASYYTPASPHSSETGSYWWLSSDEYYISIPWAKRARLLDCERPLVQHVNEPSLVQLHYKEATETSNCFNRTLRHLYYYFLISDTDYGSVWSDDIPKGCSLIISTPLLDLGSEEDLSFLNFHHRLAFGYELSWISSQCFNCSSEYRQCIMADRSNSVYCIPFDTGIFYTGSVRVNWPNLAGFLMLIRTFFGFICTLAFIIYKYRRRNLSMFGGIEDFLQSNSSLMPIRYSYSHIKKMTSGLKDKLGEGGFGCVYKGKLRSGAIVAVKILTNSNSNGKDFINEVATIGRIHHTNVVRLIGFCVEGSKRALVYEFMPNGSLEKYIFSEERTTPLSCNQMFDISVGVARAIEYIHRGCEMQILHFDIKPHNILLDENFNPRVSDFGLAKLYPAGKSMVTLTEARGTMGYIAPEMFYKNIGRVSYKADVYSFGMLLLEMAGRRKNLNVYADQSSQIYFPSWVYDEFKEGREVEMGETSEDEKKMTKKMIVTAFWCTQMKPSDRPSMDKVVQMLEGDVELLQMPRKPSLNPQEMPADVI